MLRSLFCLCVVFVCLFIYVLPLGIQLSRGEGCHIGINLNFTYINITHDEHTVRNNTSCSTGDSGMHQLFFIITMYVFYLIINRLQSVTKTKEQPQTDDVEKFRFKYIMFCTTERKEMCKSLGSAEKTCKILQVTRMKCLLIIIEIS